MRGRLLTVMAGATPHAPKPKGRSGHGASAFLPPPPSPFFLDRIRRRSHCVGFAENNHSVSVARAPRYVIVRSCSATVARLKGPMQGRLHASNIRPGDVRLGTHWLAWTDGARWGDNHFHLWPAPMLTRALWPPSGVEIVRGRVLYAALVTDPPEHPR